MPRRHGPGLTLAEWLVLCLVSQEPVHGFALAALLAPDGGVGMAWHVHKGEVYRAVQRLERLGLITAEDRQHSSQGPPRARLHSTPEGYRAAQGWLRQPAARPRDVRSELLAKLALLSRAGTDPGDLLRAQRRDLASVADGLAGAAAQCHRVRPGPGAMAARIRWRGPAVRRLSPGCRPRATSRNRPGRRGQQAKCPRPVRLKGGRAIRPGRRERPSRQRA